MAAADKAGFFLSWQLKCAEPDNFLVAYLMQVNTRGTTLSCFSACARCYFEYYSNRGEARRVGIGKER